MSAAITRSAHGAPEASVRRAEYLALALMYMAQGLPAGLAFNALGVLIRQGGHSVGDVGLSGLAFLPWALKFLWAGPIDNACARWGYARVVGVTQGLAVAACLTLTPFSPADHLQVALFGIVLLNTICATQDIATNAYAVARMQGQAAGAANGVQVAAFVVGMLIGGGGLLMVYEDIGWDGAMVAMAGLLSLLYLPLLLGRRWRAVPVGARVLAPKVRLRDLREHADLGWALSIALLFKFASTATGTLTQPWLVDRGLSLEQIGHLQMSTMVATALGGVLIGIPLVRALGNRRAVLAGCVLSAVAVGVPWGLNASGAQSLGVYYGAFVLQALCDGAMYVAVWAMVMNWASPERPGTDYTVMQCCESLANAVAAGAIGGLGQRWGYGSAFALAWVAGALVALLIAFSLRRIHLAHEGAALRTPPRRAEAPRPLGFFALMGMAPVALFGASVLAILSAALSLAPFYVLYRIAVEIFAPQPDAAAIRQLALLALAVIFLRWLMMAASHSLAHLGAFSVLFELRLRLARQLGRVPMGFFSRHNSGALRKTVIDDTGAMEGFLAHMLPDAVASATVPLAALALMAAMDWRLTLAALAPLPVAMVMQALMLRQSGERMREWQDLQSSIASQIVEFLRGMPVVKVFGLSARSFGQLSHAIQGAVRWVDRYASTSSAGWAVFMALLSANLVVVAPLGVWLHARGEVDAATLVLFLLVAPAVLQPLLRLTFAFGEQARRAEALRRIDAVLRSPVLVDPVGAQPPAREAPHTIVFENVQFAYDTPEQGGGMQATEALQGISFEAPAGCLTALVGPSGAGKSTIARLLPRFHDVTCGSVRVAGLDVRQWPLQALLSRIGIVFQEVFLFHGTVRDNLLMARPGATQAELVAAATAARAHDFIVQLPQGYDTPIGERGARLSGGERQRLSIARALLKDAPILLLDEAMAHADAENELLIQQALDVVCRGRTVLMIAHRLHTVCRAAHIVVLDGGRIAAQGRHDDLLERSPLYRQLWRDHEQARDWSLAHARDGAPQEVQP